MTAPKTVTKRGKWNYKLDGISVYEVANVAAKEMKRINNRFYAAKETPPTDLVHKTLKKVLDGEIGYHYEEKGPRNGDNAQE
jgi:hypothetical protein